MIKSCNTTEIISRKTTSVKVYYYQSNPAVYYFNGTSIKYVNWNRFLKIIVDYELTQNVLVGMIDLIRSTKIIPSY